MKRRPGTHGPVTRRLVASATMGLFDEGQGSKRRSAFGPDDSVAEAAMDAADPIGGLLPLDWTTARLELDDVGGSLRVKNISGAVTASSEPSYGTGPAEVGAWMAALGAGFSRLREVLLSENAPWDGGIAEVEREPLRRAHVRLSDTRGRVTHEIAVAPEIACGQLLNHEIVRIFADSEEARTQATADLAAWRSTVARWAYRIEQRLLDFQFRDGSAEHYPAQILGSFSEPERSWCWSWANRSYEREDYAALLSFRDKAMGYKGMGAVWRPGFFCARQFCTNVAWLVTEESGGTTVWQHDDGQGLTTFFAVMDVGG